MMPRRNYNESYDYECDLDNPGAARTRQFAPPVSTAANNTKSARGILTKRSRVRRIAHESESMQDSFQMDTPGFSMHEGDYDYSPEESDEESRERREYFIFPKDHDPFFRNPDFESPGAARTRQFQPNPASKGPRIFLPKRPRVRRNQGGNQKAEPPTDFDDAQNYGDFRREYDGRSDDDWNDDFGNVRRSVGSPSPKVARRGARSEAPAKRGAGNQLRRQQRQQQQSTFLQYDPYGRAQPVGHVSSEMVDDAGNYMETFGCNYCPKVFSSHAALTKHERRHLNDMQFACAFCPMIFIDVGSKNTHERAHEEQQQFPCSYCSLHFQSLIARRIHELQCAPEKAFTCAYCPISFITELQKEKHEKTHDEEQQSIRSYSPPMVETPPAEPPRPRKPRKKKEPQTGPKPTFACIFCPQTFTSEFMRARHLTTHPEMQTYPCNVCQMKFASIQSLNKHKQTHEKPRRFLCTYCPKDYATKERLKVHEKEHMKDMPYGCQYCSKRFMLESQKAAHELCHNGKKEFKCSQCPKVFEMESERDDHEARHRKPQFERNHQCSYCARKFHLLEHKIAHESFHPKLTCISAETVDPRIL